jgi:two-component system, chemotaxis family, chemotaxis protein CheY
MAFNVLIVDDSMVMRTMILKTIRMSGVDLGKVKQAANGKEGLEALKEDWIDLVFLDINMPVMGGEEMILRMKENELTRDIPVVVISTEGSPARIDRVESLGARFVHKPFSPETIRDVILDVTGVEVGDERGP